MPTPTDFRFVDVVVERRPVDHPWQDHAWSAVAVVPVEGIPEHPTWADAPVPDAEEGVTRHRVSGFAVELFRKETEGYKINLAQPDPRVYVVLRPDEEDADGPEIQVFHVTVCPYEAEHYIESGDETVDGVAMPDEMKAWLQGFVDTHHVEVPFKKRKRKDHDPRKGEQVRAAPRAGPRAVRG